MNACHGLSTKATKITKTTKALVSDNGEHVVIRPLVYVLESEARAYAKEAGLPIIGCCCPACGDLSLQRQRVKRLIAQLEVEHPEIKNSMLRALGNVASRHLLDRRLMPADGTPRREPNKERPANVQYLTEVK